MQKLLATNSHVYVLLWQRSCERRWTLLVLHSTVSCSWLSVAVSPLVSLLLLLEIIDHAALKCGAHVGCGEASSRISSSSACSNIETTAAEMTELALCLQLQ
jgi:hypothetical protein